MTVYVDDAAIMWKGKRWYHLTADTEAELHAFASAIGLRRDWFQMSATRPEANHYGVTDPYRDRAIAEGAVAESTRRGSVRRRAAATARGRSFADPIDDGSDPLTHPDDDYA